MKRYRVAVLRGGPSDEYDVSLKTGAAVIASIDENLFEPLDVVITKQGEWLYEGRACYPEQLISHVDVVFIALHGAYGEDGRLQRILERHAIPYTGSRSYPSAIAINKVLTKDHLRDIGVKMAPHIVVSQDSKKNLHNMAETIEDMFGPQYVIKPVNSGSSVGTMMVKNPALLPRALKDALDHYDQVLVEKRIIGKEATVGVVDRFRGHDTYVLPAIEIIPPSVAEFFNNEVKYNGATLEVCPGSFAQNEKNTLERIARDVHNHLGLSQYSRSDFMVSDGDVYFLEVNTLPGLTQESLLPKALVAVGSSHRELVNHLILDALARR